MTQPLKPLNLLTIKLKDESFHNSIGWSESSSEYSTITGKNFQIYCPDKWKKHFVKLLPPWYHLIISPLM